MTIEINVVNQKLRLATNLRNYISGTHKFIYFIFNFSENWDGLKIFAQFKQGESAYNQYLDSNNGVYLPTEITPGECTVILYGTDGTIDALTDYLTLTIDENILVTDAQSTEVPVSLYKQMISDFSKLSNEMGILENRVNTLIAGATDIDSSAELTDIREGADLVSYPTAGDAVRNQIKRIQPQPSNLWEPRKVTDGFYINSGNGEVTRESSSPMVYSDYISIFGNTIFSSQATYVQGAFYDADEKYISGFFFNHDNYDDPLTAPYDKIKAPRNACYVRLSTRSGNKNTYVFSPFDKLISTEDPRNIISAAIPKSQIVEENSNVIYDVSFSAANNSDLISKNFSYSDGYMNSSTLGAIIRYSKYITIDRSRISAIFKANSSCKFRFGYTVGNRYGAADIADSAFSVAVDISGKTMTAYKWNGNDDNTLVQIGTPVHFTFEIANEKDYYIEIEKRTVNEVYVRLYRADSPSDIAEMTLQASQIPNNVNLYKNYMRCWGGGTIQLLSGSISVKRMAMFSTGKKYPRTMVIGDSFVEQAGRNPLCGYAQRMFSASNGDVFIDGRGGATVEDVLKRIPVSLNCCHPKYVILNVGTNDSIREEDSDIEAYKRNLANLVSIVEECNSIPVVVTIPERTDRPNSVFANTINSWIRKSGYKCIDLARVLSDDAGEQEENKFNADGVHPNINGGEAIYRYIEANLPELISKSPQEYTQSDLDSYDGFIDMEASGNIISISDGSDVRLKNLKLRGNTTQTNTTGAQLCDFSKGSPVTGVTLSFENDTLIITGNGASGYQHIEYNISEVIKNNAGKTLYFDFENLTYDVVSSTFSQLVIAKTDNTEAYVGLINGQGKSVAYTIPSDVSNISTVKLGVYTCNAATGVANKVTIVKPMLQIGTDKLPYEPFTGCIAAPHPEYPQELNSVGDSGTMVVDVYGKNLLKMATPSKEPDATIVSNDDGSLTITNNLTTGTKVSGVSVVLTGMLPAGTYTFTNISGDYCYVQFASNDYSRGVNVGYSRTFDYDGLGFLRILSNPVASGETVKFKAQLEVGENSTEYEPCQEKRSAVIHTPNGLHGIPVDSGGNYTDSNGQKWVCDEIDFGRKVYIQRIAHYVFDGSSDENWYLNTSPTNSYSITCARSVRQYDTKILCNYGKGRTWSSDGNKNSYFLFINLYRMFAIGGTDVMSRYPDLTSFKSKLAETPLEIIYELETPIEFSLSAEEIEGYKHLHTNKPNTTIYNLENANMEVAYWSEIKTYLSAKEQNITANVTDLQEITSDIVKEISDIRTAIDGTEYLTAGKAIRSQISTSVNYYKVEGQASLLDNARWTSGYYLNAGIPTASASYSYCDYINVDTLSEITINNVGRCDYAFYDADKALLGLERDGWANIPEASTTVLTPHEDAVYFRLSCRTAEITGTSVTAIAPVSHFSLNREIENNDGAALRGINTAASIDIASLASGASKKIDTLPHTIFDVDITFFAKINSFDAVSITHGNNVYNGAMVKIDTQNITVYRYTDKLNVVSTQTHGLSIDKFINVIIKVEKHEAVIMVSTASGSFTSDSVTWYGARPDLHVYAYSKTSLTDCRFSWNSNALKKGIWWYGDSYVNGYAGLLCDMGYGNAMFDGYSGRASAAAWDSLNSALKYNNPNVIVWAMGMNDADTETAVSGSWKKHAQWLIELCSKRQIELIFLTIPNVPGVNNSFKNQFIRESGCRYIDIAEFVGATETESTWYDGLLGADQIHASDIGKQIIASYIAAQLPQLRRE